MDIARRFKYLIVSLIAFLVVGFYGLVTFNLSFMGPVANALKNFSMTDVYYQIQQSMGVADTCRFITLVDMTELYAREDLAAGLQDIMDYEPKAVGIDMVFEGLKPDTASDMWLKDIATNYPQITWAFKLLDWEPTDQEWKDAVHSFFAEEVEPKEGFVNMPRDLYEGVKRTTPVGWLLNGEMKTSWVNSVADTYAGQQIMPITVKEININFHHTEFPKLYPHEVIDHPELIKDHIVLYGPLKEETDMHYCPLGKVAGTELLAYAVKTIVTGTSLKYLPTWFTVIMSILIVAFTSWMIAKYGRWANSHINNDYWRTFMTSAIVTGFITFVWMAFLTYIGFVVFALFSYSVNFGWAFSGIAFRFTAENFYRVFFEPDHKKS